MDWQLHDIGKTITNNILPSILSSHTVSIWRFHSVSIGFFVNIRIWTNLSIYVC